jgi:hypothetical protein
VSLRFAIAFAGAAFATVGLAQAQERPAASENQTPWYERYTLESQEQNPIRSMGANDSASWRINGRWGVTVDVPQERAAPLAAPGQRDEAAFGAYFQVNPSIRVGGQVGISRPVEQTAAPRTREESQADAAVRIQSAFRF